ncbi:MAG TPA: hypothetical protein PK082_02850 [Phycisphaerae bacterium]|nr:hypothetical protein [Phycisphaerae bacterium]
MGIRIYKDAALAEPLSSGDGTRPDSDVYDGMHGEARDRQLYLANEHATLAEALGSSGTTLVLEIPAFANGETIIVDAEQMKVLAGSGTAMLTVERGYAGAAPAAHVVGSIAWSGYDYTDVSVGVIDASGADETAWYRFATAQAALDAATPGASISVGDKPCLETLTIWRRCAVPGGTPVQNKADLRIRVTGVEYPLS